MRILLVTNYQPPHMGGIEYAAQALKKCWIGAGHEVTWLTTDVPRGGRPTADDNIRIPALNFLEDCLQVNTPLVSPLSYPRIARAVRAHDVVMVHSLAPGLTAAALWAAVRNRRPTVATQHVGIIPLRPTGLFAAQNFYLRRAANWAVGHGIPITFVGHAVRRWFVEHTRIRAEDVVMTPAGIDASLYRLVGAEERAALCDKWGLSGSGLNVLFVGRFVAKKGLDLIRAAAEACPTTRFTLIGGGPIDPSAWNLRNVRTIAYVTDEELREMYGCHDVLLMPSVGEGWPAVVAQAMACGLGCIISGETFEGYGRDPDRFIVCKRDAGVIAQILQKAAEGDIPVLREREELSRYARQTWNWQVTADIYLDLFRRQIERL